MLTPNRWTEIKWNLEERCFIVTLYVANPLPDGTGHYAAQATDRARAHTNEQAQALGATMLKNDPARLPVCPNCQQYQRPPAGDCLNECSKRGFAKATPAAACRGTPHCHGGPTPGGEHVPSCPLHVSGPGGPLA